MLGQRLPKEMGEGKKKEEEQKPSFFSMIPGAFAFPFKGGIVGLIAGAVVFGILDVIVRYSITGFVIGAIMLGYLCSYWFKVIEISAIGKDTPPEWPGFSNFFGDVFGSILMLLGIIAFSYALPIIYTILLFNIPGLTPLPLPILILLSHIYFPMAFFGVALHKNMACAAPNFVIPSILRVPGEYFVTCFIFFVLSIIAGVLQSLARVIPFVGIIVGMFLTLYFFLVQTRLLGLIYYCSNDKLKWD